MPNEETKKFNRVIKARRSRERRILRMKSGWKMPIKVEVVPSSLAHEWKAVPGITYKLPWWRRLLKWLKRK